MLTRFLPVVFLTCHCAERIRQSLLKYFAHCSGCARRWLVVHRTRQLLSCTSVRFSKLQMILLGGRSPQAYVSDDRRDPGVGAGHLPRGANVEAQGHAGALRLRTPLFETARDLPRTHEEVSIQFYTDHFTGLLVYYIFTKLHLSLLGKKYLYDKIVRPFLCQIFG